MQTKGKESFKPGLLGGKDDRKWEFNERVDFEKKMVRSV